MFNTKCICNYCYHIHPCKRTKAPPVARSSIQDYEDWANNSGSTKEKPVLYKALEKLSFQEVQEFHDDDLNQDVPLFEVSQHEIIKDLNIQHQNIDLKSLDAMT